MVETILLILCVILLFCFYTTNHIYKSEYTGISKYNIGFIFGTIVTVVINGFAWYYIFKMMEIID
jgi:hypothetical protein